MRGHCRAGRPEGIQYTVHQAEVKAKAGKATEFQAEGQTLECSDFLLRHVLSISPSPQSYPAIRSFKPFTLRKVQDIPGLYQVRSNRK